MNKDEIKIIESEIECLREDIKSKEDRIDESENLLVSLKNKENLSHVGKCFKQGLEYMQIVGLMHNGELLLKYISFFDISRKIILDLEVYSGHKPSIEKLMEWDVVEISEEKFFEQINYNINRLLLKEFKVELIK